MDGIFYAMLFPKPQMIARKWDLSVSETELNSEVWITMDHDLNIRKEAVVRCFLNKGLAPSIVFELIEYMARSVFIDPELSAFEIKEGLYRTHLPLVDLEDSLLQEVKQCLVLEGRKGIEYRFGKGFNYLNN